MCARCASAIAHMQSLNPSDKYLINKYYIKYHSEIATT
jgi:hypothetical protein